MTKGIGQPVRRKEDARLITGAGCFSDDVNLPRQTRAFVLRSVHAHARIRAVDTTRAKALRGVLAVLTGADLKADGIKPIPPDASITVPVEAQRKLPDVVLVNKGGAYRPTQGFRVHPGVQADVQCFLVESLDAYHETCIFLCAFVLSYT